MARNNSFRVAVKSALPPSVRLKVQRGLAVIRQSRGLAQARETKDFWADAARYAKYADWGESARWPARREHLEAQLTRDYHRVEKGLALAEPKRPFGAELLTRFDALIPVAEEIDPDSPYLGAAQSARSALVAWNEGGLADSLVAPIAQPVDRDVDADRFFRSRHSVRDFSQRSVSAEEIYNAIELAACSPSVCNRGPWRVRLFFGDDVPRVLAYQNGNRGFTHDIPAVAVISVELGFFAGPGERNQAWIEGGIFASSLVWALHGTGLDSCMLNLSLRAEMADELRNAIGMPASEVPIMMMAIGRGRPGHRVARSPRRSWRDLVIG